MTGFYLKKKEKKKMKGSPRALIPLLLVKLILLAVHNGLFAQLIMFALEENTHIHQYRGYKGSLSIVYINRKLVTLRPIIAYVCILDFSLCLSIRLICDLVFVLCFVCCQSAVKQGNRAHSYGCLVGKWLQCIIFMVFMYF